MYSFSYLEPVCYSMSSSNCFFLTWHTISQEAGQVVWYSHLFQNFPQFLVIQTVKGFGIVNKAEIDVFLEFSCFFNDPAYVGNLISGSSAFSKSNLNIWKFAVHVLLKPILENFEYYFPSIWDECNYVVVWVCQRMKLEWNLRFSSTMATAEFFKFADILSAALSQHHLLGFEIGPLEFHDFHQLCFQWCLLRPACLSITGCLALGEWSHHHGYLGHKDLFCSILQCALATSFNIFCFCCFSLFIKWQLNKNWVVLFQRVWYRDDWYLILICTE